MLFNTVLKGIVKLESFMQNQVATSQDRFTAVRGFMVGHSRYWNNSMYEYDDSAVVFMNGELKTVYLGVDIWDGTDPERIKADTPASVLAEYSAFERRKARKAQANILRANLRQESAIALSAGCPRRRVRALRKVIWPNQFADIGVLFTTKLRSAFRISLRDQVAAWLRDEKPRYPAPLSPKQFDSLIKNY